MYGTDMLEWDPVTIDMQLSEDLRIDIPDGVMDKLNAASSILQSNLFHISLETFNVTCTALSRGLAITDGFTPASLSDSVWGVTEANLLEGNDFWSQGFGHNIARYVGVLLDQGGVYTPPKMLQFAEYPDGVQERNYESFSGDELEFRVFWDRQQELKNTLEGYAKQRMAELFNELASLPIKGMNKEFVDKILNNLKA
jgi:hypothetical protein